MGHSNTFLQRCPWKVCCKLFDRLLNFTELRNVSDNRVWKRLDGLQLKLNGSGNGKQRTANSSACPPPERRRVLGTTSIVS